MPAASTLVSFDIGGTLADAAGPTLASVLAEASPLEPANAYRVLREILHVVPVITPGTAAQVCRALLLPQSAFPEPLPTPLVTLRTNALSVLAALSHKLPVVTLSNVTCVDANGVDLPSQLGPAVRAHYRSCEIGYVKPDPRAFHTVALGERVAIERLVHVGDHWECDVLGAVHAGATAIWLSRGRSVPTAALREASRVHVVEDLADVPAIISALTEGQS
jgi:FMN phosphatase YigB (HAD superfamily)